MMSMARRDQGKQDEARDLLALVYGWFTGGFNSIAAPSRDTRLI
jgi:hypothetical protein